MYFKLFIVSPFTHRKDFETSQLLSKIEDEKLWVLNSRRRSRSFRYFLRNIYFLL